MSVADCCGTTIERVEEEDDVVEEEAVVITGSADTTGCGRLATKVCA